MSAENTPPAEEEGSLLPAALGGAGILVAAALLIFWPTDSDDGAGAGDKSKATASDKASKTKAGGPGGVASRQVDEASGPQKGVRRNPAVRLPPVGMSPNPPPPSEPPEFETKEQELAWHQDQLAQAERNLAFRQKAHGRLDKIRENIENSPNPEQGMEAFESRKKIVVENLEAAERRVEELKKKVAELGG